MSNIRLYLNVQNPFTIAKEDLVDPEVVDKEALIRWLRPIRQV